MKTNSVKSNSTTGGKNFYFGMSLVFWVTMAVGFSDNWWFDVAQESNSDPKFIIHAAFAFSWFTLLVVQSALVRASFPRTHMSLGIWGVFSYAGFFASTFFIYVTRALADGFPKPLSLLNIIFFVFATILIVRGFQIRKENPHEHKTNIMLGSFFLMEPGIGRAIGHIFGPGSEAIWLLTYLGLFAAFTWHYRRVNWQLGTGFFLWMLGTTNIILNSG